MTSLRNGEYETSETDRERSPEPDQNVVDDAAITVNITQRVRPGREQDFEQYLRGIASAASNFPGFLGVNVVRPVRPDIPYRTMLRFERESDMRRWEESEEQQIWAARGAELAEEARPITNITGTAQEAPLRMLLTPLEDYVRVSVSGIGLLMLGTILALFLANSPWSDAYTRFWETKLTIGTVNHGITESLQHWVNDCLMALFFFFLGLEIKREILVGELRYVRQAALPISAAIGGAIIPAVIFLVLNLSGNGIDGWGIPIGTDTAFSLGIISLFAGRVRPLLLVFLTAFAIVDDILAVLVIAVFYTENLVWEALVVAALLLLALVIANRAGIQRWPVYAFLGVAVWLAVFESGIHGTIAGVLVAMIVPARSWINPSEFLVRGRQLMDEFERSCFMAPTVLSNEPQQQVTQALEELTEQVETPLTHFQHQLYPWITFGVLPLFAFANAGIPVVDGFGNAIGSLVTWGVIAGLVVGKPVGITLFSWLAVRVGIARLPASISWQQLFAVAWLGGIGFTMSLFITELAFGVGAVADEARIGVLAGSVVAGAVGYFILRRSLPSSGEQMAARIEQPDLTFGIAQASGVNEAEVLNAGGSGRDIA